MSDEEGVPFSIFPVPEEVREAMIKQRDRAHMEAEDFKHAVDDILEGFTPAQIITVRELLTMIQNSDTLAPYIQGKLSAILKYKHKVCESCGKDHEAELLAPTPDGEVKGQEPLPFDRTEVSLSDKDEADLARLVDPIEAPRTEAAADLVEGMGQEAPLYEPPSEVDKERHDSMVKYNVRYPESGEVRAYPHEDPVICKGCGALYQSLADRMLRDPGVEGCGTCIEKAKWG